MARRFRRRAINELTDCVSRSSSVPLVSLPAVTVIAALIVVIITLIIVVITLIVGVRFVGVSYIVGISFRRIVSVGWFIEIINDNQSALWRIGFCQCGSDCNRAACHEN